PPPATRAGPLEPVIRALMKRDPAARPGATGARRLLTAACKGRGLGTGDSALDGPGTSHGSGALDPARAASGGKGATADDARADPGTRGGTGGVSGTPPLPVSLPPDGTALAGQPPAAMPASPMLASPMLASPVPAQPLAVTQTAWSAPVPPP